MSGGPQRGGRYTVVLTVLAAEPPARGAGLNQVIGLSIAAMVIGAVMLYVGWAHRTHRITWLTSVAEWLGGKFDRPSWVALPVLVFTTSIICALFGFIWDVSWHIGNGRDPGPLANPAHYFIIIGLFGIFVAGMLAVVLPFDKPGPAALRITRNWHAPVGGLLMAACGMYAMIGFPLDDIWHRIFGQDVTLWGPTHLMMIGGANFSLFAVLMLEYEGERYLQANAPADGAVERKDRPFVRFVRYLSCGGLLIGMSVYQIEFDFGVPQFRLVFQPMLIAAAAAMGTIVARITLGGGAANIASLLPIRRRGGGADRGPLVGSRYQLVPALSRTAAGGRTGGAHPTVPPADPVWGGFGSGHRHGRPVARIAMDRQGLSLPVADVAVARSAADGGPGGDLGRHLRGAARDGAHQPATTRSGHRRHRGGAHSARHRRHRGQRSAHPCAQPRHRHRQADRPTECTGTADGVGRRPDQPTRCDQRPSGLADGAGLARQDGQRARSGDRSVDQSWTGALRLESSASGVGLMEDVGAHPRRPDAGGSADLGTR